MWFSFRQINKAFINISFGGKRLFLLHPEINLKKKHVND